MQLSDFLLLASNWVELIGRIESHQYLLKIAKKLAEIAFGHLLTILLNLKIHQKSSQNVINELDIFAYNVLKNLELKNCATY